MIRVVVIALVTVVVVVAGALGFAYHTAELPALDVAPIKDHTFANLTVINPGKRARRHQTVTIEEGKIAKIARSSRSERSVAVRYALPGLIDLHTHNAFYEPDVELYNTLYLMHGVTTIRGMGGDRSILDLKKRTEFGERIGPRMFGCGSIIDGPLGNWASINIEEPEEARELVAELVEQGADCIKVFPNIPAKTFRAIREEATKAGLPLVGRMNNKLGIEGAALDDIQHLHGILDIVSPNVSAEALSVWTKQWAKGYDDERMELAVRMAGVYGSAHTPSLVGLGYQAYRGSKNAIVSPIPELMPAWYRKVWGQMYYSQDKQERKVARKALKKLMEAVSKLHKAKVPIHAGSDTGVDFTVPGRALHDELRLMVEAGLTPTEALVTATSAAGKALGVDGLGTLVEGSPADMVIFIEDPTKDLDNLNTLDAIVVNGRYYSARTLKIHHRKQLKEAKTGVYRVVSDVMGPVLSAALGFF